MRKVLMVLFVLFSLFLAPKVQAETYKLTLEKQSGIYYVRKGGTIPDKASQYYVYKVGNNIAYCVQPSHNITTYNYKDSGGYINLPYSDEVKEKIELIGYYGREYPGHNNVRYSMAAQALIWELTGAGTVTYYTGPDGTGSKIDITKERSEILELVSNHYKVLDIPTIVSTTYNGEFKIQDEMLYDFYISDDGGNNGEKGEVYLENDELRIYSRIIGKSSITLTKKRYDDKTTLIFVGDDKSNSQTLGRLRASKDVNIKINLDVKGIKIKIIKVDENNQPLNISGIKFKVKDLSTNQYICDNNDCTYSTNNEGYVFTKELNFGDYEIEEVENQVIPGYLWNSKKETVMIRRSPLYFNFTDDHFVKVQFANKSVKANILVHKQGERWKIKDNKIVYEKIDLEGIQFDLFDNRDNYLDTLITDNSGNVVYQNLAIGKYYLVEKNALENYVQPEKYYFEIKQNNQYDEVINMNVNIDNYLKKGSVEISKLDSVNYEGIADTVIELYDSENNLLMERITDNNGQIIINDLPVGKYYLLEKKSNDLYQLSNEKVFFEIKEHNEIVKKEILNEKIKGSVEIIKKGEKYTFKDNKIIYENVPLNDMEFMLYDNHDKFIDIIKIDENGYAKYDNLVIGHYYIIEKYTPKNYVEDNTKYSFEIKKENNTGTKVKLEIQNYLRKGKLVFTKNDLETMEGISDTIIEIYNELDELLLTKKTDDTGQVIIDNLPEGKYYIIEKEANNLYQITNEKVYFEINNNETTEALMMNERKIVEVPNTGQNDKTLVSQICGLIFSVGIVFRLYEKKKAY